MIKVIRHGKKRKCTCFNCGCFFSFQNEDVSDRQGGFNEFDKFVACPDCGEENVIE